VKFLAALAVVPIADGLIDREAIAREKKERAALTNDAGMLLAVEKAAWIDARDDVLQLEAIRRGAGVRLNALHLGAPERWPGETELCWDALAKAYRQMPHAAATYNVISFAPQRDRLAFALDAKTREQLVEEALERGFVAGTRCYHFEVIL